MNPVTLRYPKSTWFGGLFGMAIFAILAAGGIGFTALLIANGADWQMSAMIGLLTAFLFGLGRYVGGDAWGKFRWRIDIDGQQVKLRLPAGRSISYKLRSVSRRLARADIAAIEHRLEVYTTLGMANPVSYTHLTLPTNREV